MRFADFRLFNVLKKLLAGSEPPSAAFTVKPAIAPNRPVIVLPPTPAAMQNWQTAFRLPFGRPRNRTEQRVHDALRANQPLTFAYGGGSEAGVVRTVDPILLFRVEGFDGAYLIGYCRLRQEFRTFLIARMKLRNTSG